MICSHNYVGLRCYIVYSRIECLEIIWQKRQGANFDEFNANLSEFYCKIWINLRTFDFMTSVKEDWKKVCVIQDKFEWAVLDFLTYC